MNINAYAALAEKQTLQLFQYDPKSLGPYDVEVKISHCGICHSDIHLIDNDWGSSEYPLVPGHEIVGEITETGPRVRHLETGQRVGIGWQRSACLTCEFCERGEENLCARSQSTCVRDGNYGGFADFIRSDSRFVFPIPDSLESADVGPLLCGGITVYSPLRRYSVDPTMRVGVMGIGGLGHMALQFARAFGCEVTAFSTTPEKEAEAKLFGAHHFVCSTDSAAMESATDSLDFIISTLYVDLDWATYLNILRRNGKLCVVGASRHAISAPFNPLLVGQKSICGSVIGGRAVMREMLQFAERHGIHAKTELAPMSEVNAAVEKVRKGQARYRMVVKN